ncbi:MAG TPA: histidine--tRNA ligase [Actinobacteria bacterium]|nr:histidine--tRNA ligase [Actinomycetota bacterium]
MIPRVKGTDDILPPESARWRALLRGFDDLAARYGYDLAVMPVLESTELFSRGVGAGTDVVEKQMYTFEDQGGRSVTLRPEFTAGIVRAYLESGGTGVMKLAAAGPQFRYEQPQKGRRRQFYQVDLECVGDPDSRADVEIIEMSHRLLTELGVPGVTLQLNSIGDAADRSQYRDLLRDYLRGVAGELSPDSRRRIDDNPLRVLDSKADAALVAAAPVPLDHLGPETAAHFAAVRAGLEEAGIAYEIAPRLVRGLDYYNRTVFEFYSTAFEAAQSALGGGGRYDPLAELVGSRVPVAGVGVALGCDRIVAAMPEPAPPRLDLFVAVATPVRSGAAGAWVRSLRASGHRVDWTGGDRSLKAQFKAADRSGAAVVAIVGDEWDAGQVRLKRLATGEEAAVDIEEVGAWLNR